MNTASEEPADGVAYMTADKCVEFEVRLSVIETDATTWRITDTDHGANQLERLIHGITSYKQMRCKNELSICLIKVDVVEGNWYSGAQEHHRTACYPYRTSKDGSWAA
jgi:hypothetical protein